MDARLMRLMSDWEKIKQNFQGHPYIQVTPIGAEPPERYHIVYLLDGISMQPDGTIQVEKRHEVEITLTAEYPRYKPVCKILTPIWHPNFKDGQICIGDIWGAGESLSDIIINIGDMIQYKSWNSSSPLSADAANWALENKNMFPIGHAELTLPDHQAIARVNANRTADVMRMDQNDFVITPEELQGVTFVSSEQRMQQARTASGGKGSINIRTILVKGILWAFLGAFLGFLLSEVTGISNCHDSVARMMGYPKLAQYYEYNEKEEEAIEDLMTEYSAYCKNNHLDDEDSDNFTEWLGTISKGDAIYDIVMDYLDYSDLSDEALNDSYADEFYEDEDEITSTMSNISRITTALWACLIALMVGLALGIGEGVYYGSREKAIKYGAIGAGIALVIGFIGGYLAQWMYGAWISDVDSTFLSSLIRGIGWAIMGLGIGAAIGLIKPEIKRILFCGIGGTAGAFIGGFLFNYITEIIPNDIAARGIAIIVMCLLIGLGIGLLEQFAKSAWLKVVRGEFEGKEFLVFTGTTSIGNNASNMIVLFKDRLVEEHHCDIIQRGSQYEIVNTSKQMGTFVNGMPITQATLHKGDSITVGNSVLVFQMK